MVALQAAHHLCASVLVLSGLGKLRTPLAVVSSLRTLRLPSSPGAARALGLVELAVGTAALLWSSRASAALLAAMWAALAVAAALLVRRGQEDCGCFGVTGATIGRGHLAVDVLGAAVATATLVAGDPVPAVLDLPDVTAVGTVTYAVLLATGAAAVAASLTLWPRTAAEVAR